MLRDGKVSLREAFGKTIVELAEMRSDFWVLDADVAGGTCSHWFRDRFPHRFVQCGIAEQNMMAVAAGISSLGIIPVVTCYAVFASMRAIEQARNMIAYGGFNVKIVASHVGVDVGPDGATHQAIEDLAIYRSIPGFTVLSPCDDVELKAALEWALEYEGPVYMRTGRSPVPRVHHEDYEFRVGEPEILKKGRNDIVIMATGITVHRALNVARDIEDLTIVSVPTFKPINADSFYSILKDKSVVITVEDHNIIGGLGSLVAEIISEMELNIRLVRVGIEDIFGKSGDPKVLADIFGIGQEPIRETVLSLRG